MGIWTEPSPSDWDRWLALIFDVDGGSTPGDAARTLGFGGSSTFKRSDPARHRDVLDRYREDRDERNRQTARDTFQDVIKRALTPIPILYQGKPTGHMEYDPASAISAAEKLGKAAGLFTEHVDLSVSGPNGGPIEIEDRSATLDAVARVLDRAGVLAQLGRRATSAPLPAAGEVLPTPPHG